MKLNGWQRLWVVAAVLWIFPVLAVSYLNWPSHALTPAGSVPQEFISSDPFVEAVIESVTVRRSS